MFGALARVHSLAAVRCDCQHGERHVPYPVGRRRDVLVLTLLTSPRTAEVRAVYGLQLVHVVIVRALAKQAHKNGNQVWENAYGGLLERGMLFCSTNVRETDGISGRPLRSFTSHCYGSASIKSTTPRVSSTQRAWSYFAAG